MNDQRMIDTKAREAYSLARYIARHNVNPNAQNEQRIKELAPWTKKVWDDETRRYCAGWIDVLE